MRLRCKTLLGVLMLACAAASSALQCPPQPVQKAKNVDSAISAAAGRIGPARAAEISVKTKVEVDNLMARYPNADRLYVIQQMGSTLCQFLNESKSIGDTDKLDRWTAFQKESFHLMAPSAR